MPIRKRTTNIGVYPRVLGFPFALGLTFLGVLIFSSFAAIIALNVFVMLVPTVLCFFIIQRIKKKYGDFFSQKSQITRRYLYKSHCFILQLHHGLLRDKIKKENDK